MSPDTFDGGISVADIQADNFRSKCLSELRPDIVSNLPWSLRTEVVEQSMKFIISYVSVAFEFDGSIQRKERFGYPLAATKNIASPKEGKRNGLIKKQNTNEHQYLLRGNFSDHLQASDTETSIELNFAVLKFKHTIKKKGK